MAETHPQAEKIRKNLSATLRDLWGEPEAFDFRTHISENVETYATALRNTAKRLRLKEEYERTAERTKAGDLYRKIWGKKPKGK